MFCVASHCLQDSIGSEGLAPGTLSDGGMVRNNLVAGGSVTSKVHLPPEKLRRPKGSQEAEVPGAAPASPQGVGL